MNDKIRVLVIEDDLQDYEYLKVLLQSAQTPVSLIHKQRINGSLEGNCGNFDIILLDLNLPDSQGYDTFETVRNSCPEAPIILLTGNDNEGLAIQAARDGAQDYLVKGRIESDLLIRSINYAIERHRLVLEIEESQKKAHHLAYHDALTGLPNRQLFFDRLNHAIAQANRSKHLLAVFFLDLDNFKPINDFYGHQFGDELLKKVAVKLKNCVRESDTVARLGGDEFTIIVDNFHETVAINQVAEKLIGEIAKPYQITGKDISVLGSLGISIYPDDGLNAATLVRNADLAMYRAKNSKKRMQLYNQALDAQASKYFQEEAELQNSLENGDFVLHFQPQVDLNTNRIIGVEALLRWQHPVYGLLQPLSFLPSAEETGMIVPIGEWVIRKTCEQHLHWRQAGIPDVRVSVNLSAKQFRVSQLKSVIDQALNDYNVPPSDLVLEITETNAMQDVNHTATVLHELRELGVLIALDDFGTGYASLNYLKLFPLDILKIDRSFVNELHESHEDWSIVSAIIHMSHKLGLKVMAEGVEHSDQLAFLKALGCDEYQGFYKSVPLPPDHLYGRLAA